MLWTADVFDEVAELLAQRSENFIFVFNGLYSSTVSILHSKEGQSRIQLESPVYNIPSRKGINSSRVRSGPSARAMVDSRCMALSLRITSSCCALVSVVCPFALH